MSQSESNENKIKLLINSAAGIYIPRNFYRHFDFKAWNLDISDYPELSDPDNEHYWDAWAEVMDQAEHFDGDGHRWLLWQDDDLFAAREDYRLNGDDEETKP